LLWRIGNPVTFIAVLIANSSIGRNIGRASNNYVVLIQPASWAFGIWGIIYTLLTGFCIWQSLHKTEKSGPIVKAFKSD